MPGGINMGDGLGASVPDQALAVPVEPARALAPTGFDPSRLGNAIALATRAHAHQRDKGGAPYIMHPLRVMLAVEKLGEDAMIAAVLHDVVEDCGIFLHDIAMQFGGNVAGAVDALTRRDGESYDTFIERCGQNEIALRVKREDLSDNARVDRLGRMPTAEDWARINKYSRAFERLHAIAMEAGNGRDGATRLDGEAATARAEGIAQPSSPSDNHP